MIEPSDRPVSRVWEVGALHRALAAALAARFAACTVRGELSGLSRAASGHVYFALKDASGEAAMVRCAMFRRAASLLDFQPADGQCVEVRGRIALYEARGELQLVVEAMRPAGAGALYEQFLRLRDRLAKEGLFDPARKRPLPAFVRRVGIVTSLGAAALRDVAASLARRAPHVEAVIYPAPVQGAEAPAALAQALALAARRDEVDLLLLVRGGGSLEDLWAFNDEVLVRAVAASALPVVCGVGHETDVTLADLAADLRAPTPTAAAELATVATADRLAALGSAAQRLQRRVRHGLEAQQQRLDNAAWRIARPAEGLQRSRHRLALLEQRSGHALRQALQVRRHALERVEVRWQQTLPRPFGEGRQHLERLAARLAAVAPQNVLARGYAWLADAAGQPVTSAEALVAGQRVEAVLADGSVPLQVLPRRPAPG